MHNKKRKIVSSSTGFVFPIDFTFHSHFLFLALSVLLLLFSLTQSEKREMVGINAVDVMLPLIEFVNAPIKSLAYSLNNVSDVAKLQAENKELHAENARLREWYQVALMLEAENQSLKELLSLNVEPRDQYIAAYVVSDAAMSFLKSVIISAGEMNKIKSNQAVLAGDGLIGRVVSVGKNAARVLLITDINSRIPVVIEGGKQKAVISGNNGVFLDIKHVSDETVLSEGGQVVTSGHGGVFPKGLPVGVLFKNKEGDFQVKPYTDINRISYVRVIQSTEEVVQYE